MTRQELFTWIRQQYGTEPEYPWHDWNAVLRHNDNNKWYGVVLEVSADKLGLPEAGIIDVLNVKSDPLLIGSLRGQDGYFPAYHMNKEKWLSIQLGKPELDDAIKDLLSLSYELTAPKKRKPKSSAKNPGDFANGKEKETDEGGAKGSPPPKRQAVAAHLYRLTEKDEQALPGTLSCGCCDCR